VGIGLTLQQVEGWRGQLARVMRWRERVATAANGEPSADEIDFLLAFFESAYHLRDWLVETGAVSNVEVDGYVASHIELQLCRDIANGFKHHSLRRPSIDAEFAIVNQYVPPNERGRRYRLPNGEWTILANGTQLGLVDLSERVLLLWNRFLVQRNLNPSGTEAGS
jgi:hypothetical protein